MDTWGISGSEWLKLYGVLLVVPFVVGLIWWLVQAVRPAPATPDDLTVHHLAYLAGGRRRLAESALARLLAAKRVRVNSKGLISVVPGESVKDRTERTVLGLASRKRIYQVVKKLGPLAARMNGELAAAGLAVPEKAVQMRRKAVAMLSLSFLLLGVVRLGAGVANHRPVGWLVVELAAGVLLVIVAFRVRRRDTMALTVAGRRALRAAKATQLGRTTLLGAGLATAGAGVAGAVALGGMSYYPDPAIHTALAYVPASFSGGGGGSGSGYNCSSGSSCGGGGSSCGSSCGGGGGCGG